MVIAIGGAFGTLSEVAFARALGRPVVVLEPGLDFPGEGIERARSPGEAVEKAFALATGGPEA